MNSKLNEENLQGLSPADITRLRALYGKGPLVMNPPSPISVPDDDSSPAKSSQRSFSWDTSKILAPHLEEPTAYNARD